MNNFHNLDYLMVEGPNSQISESSDSSSLHSSIFQKAIAHNQDEATELLDVTNLLT